MPTTKTPKPRGWFHCRGSDRMHYLLDGKCLCGASHKPEQPFVPNTVGAPAGRKSNGIPHCPQCSEAHAARWIANTMPLPRE